jgi:hypothetical protein
MRDLARSSQPGVNTSRSGDQDTHLQGRLHRAVQIIWILVAMLALLVFVVGLPAFYGQIQSVCVGNNCTGAQVPVEQARALEAHGISLTSYALYSVIVVTLSTLTWFSIGWLIFWRKSDSWIALLVALQAVTQGVSSSLPALEQGPSLWHYLATLLDFLNTVLLFMVFALFPNGRFVPKWTRWLALVWIAFNVLSYADTPFAQASWFPTFSFASFLIFMGILVLAQIYRYRSVSTVVERQQTKWIVFAFATIILSELVFLVPLLFSPALSQPGSLYNLIISNVSILVLLLGPFSLYLAITRYRLYDIDVIIRRTLVYSILTTLLALVYFGLVIGLQSLVQLVTGTLSEQPLVIVASTLAIAALFQPLRRGIQRSIDRRFYRSKYDAAKTVAAFSATLRQEVDLEQLREQLLAVVQETMQPAHVSLWLRPPEHDEKQRAPWRATPPASSEGR